MNLMKDIITGIARKNLPRNRLPSELDIVSYFRFKHETQKHSIGRSIQEVACDALAIWDQAGFPHQLKRNVVRRIAKLIQNWQRLKKAKKRSKSNQAALKFCKKQMDVFFDISESKIKEKLQNDPVRSEVWNHQVISKSSIEIPKTVLSSLPVTCKQCTSKKTKKNEKKTIPREARRSTVREPSTDATGLTMQSSRRQKILTNAVIENIDRTRVSNRGAVGVLAATAVAFGFGAESLSLSKSTLQRKRKVVSIL